MAVDAARVLENLEALRTLTGDDMGAQRVAWAPVWLKARAWFEALVDALPNQDRIERHYDAAGNHWVTLRGASERALLLGSHLDSVPNGGWLDGCLGVMAAFEVLRALNEQYAGRPPVTVRLVDWADEEGARFGRSLFGSSAFAGTHSIAADRVRTDRDGLTLEAALAGCGVAVEAIGDASAEQANAAAYLELHIEQGPVLERLGLPLAVVAGTKGVERHAITFHGQEAHSGSTPMAVRRDALAAAAKLALEIRPIAMKHPDAVATMGSVKTFPGIVTAVVGRCETTLDMRDLNAGVLAQMFAEARAASERFAAEEGCTVEWKRIWSIEPIPFDAGLIALAASAIEECTGDTAPRLPSGPLHDAAEVARCGIPTVMLFVQSLNGLSHNRAEDTLREHLELAVEAFGLLAEKTVGKLLPGEIVRQQTPEEAELLRKREELAAVRAALVERELELADLRAQLKSFEGRYLREVGILYAELDEWNARIAELEASLNQSPESRANADDARKRADETREATQGEASKARDFKPSANLKNLFREVAKRIHPDFAKDDADRQRRTRLMAQANQAYGQADADRLRRILDDYHESSEAVDGEGIGAELIRLIRQIHEAKNNIWTIEQELVTLRSSEMAHLKQDAEIAQQQGRDMVAELATIVRGKVTAAMRIYEARKAETKLHG